MPKQYWGGIVEAQRLKAIKIMMSIVAMLAVSNMAYGASCKYDSSNFMSIGHDAMSNDTVRYNYTATINGVKYRIRKSERFNTSYLSVTVGDNTYTSGSSGSKRYGELYHGNSSYNNDYMVCGNFESFVRTEYEYSTNTCPTTHPNGVISMRRSYDLWSDGSKRNYSGWVEASRTCAAVKTGISSETQTLSCPATHPAGTWTQSRTFETWSDGVPRNHSAWTDVTKNCAATKIRNATETQTLACPALTPSGTWQQSRTYEVWTDGNRNFGAWSNVSVCYNQTPSVSNRTLVHDEDTTGTLTLTAVDDHSQITYELMSQPANGSASVSGTQLRFTPRANWNGTTTLTYRAIDPAGAISNSATVTINVRPVNDAPVASNGTLTVAEDTAGTVTLVATDVEGDSLTYSVVTQPNAAHGTVTISGNKATFTPKPNWNGTTSFTYRANDGTVNSNTATVTVTVTPVNDAPVGMTPLTIRTIEGRTVEVKVTVVPN